MDELVLIHQLQERLGGNRIVRGIVDATSGTPVVVKGTGFTVTDNGVGLYTINFTVPFADAPSVLVTAREGAGGIDIVVAKLRAGTPVTASAARVVCYRWDTSAGIDAVFHFAAIGPA